MPASNSTVGNVSTAQSGRLTREAPSLPGKTSPPVSGPGIRWCTLAAMFGLGFFSLLAQVMFVREMLVVFLGNELSIAALLASWLVGIGLGAYVSRFFAMRVLSLAGLRAVLAGAVFAPGLCLPAQVFVIRDLRRFLNVPVGEYASLGLILGSAAVIFLPLCICVGLCFPFACRIMERAGGKVEQPADAVSRVYMFEAAGSMLGGAVLTFLLLPRLTPLQIILCAITVSLAASVAVVPCRWLRRVGPALVLGLFLVAVAYPPGVASLESWAVTMRWKAFGILRDSADGERAPDRLVATSDTVYQNLAIIESAGQYTLYANGQVQFSFPDPIGDEHAIHFIMAQNPGAKRVLVLGGNPVGQLQEILKYPVERVVHVDLDPGVGRLLSRIVPGEYERIRDDPRTVFVPSDAPRFVKKTSETFDAVIINAPDPATAGDNRFHSVEFFQHVRRVLSAHGFIVTSVTSSERLQEGPAQLGAAVYRALREVFPVVLVTAEAETRFVAGLRQATRTAAAAQDELPDGITLDRDILYRRSKAAGVVTRYFRPEYFRFADELMPDKREYVMDRFRSAAVPLNSDLRPVAHFYNLRLWSRYSESGIEEGLRRLQKIRSSGLLLSMAAGGLVFLAAGCLLRRTAPGATRVRGAWSRTMAGLLVCTTGFCGMALEIALLLVFQGLYGYVYTRMGLIVAIFMLGLVLGAPCGRWLARRSAKSVWVALAGIELVLLLVALAIPHLAALASARCATVAVEVAIHAVIALVGWAVGAEFPMGNRVFCAAGGTVGTAAAITDASDHLGAAVGALVMGVLLVPVYGVGTACVLLAAVKGMGLLIAASGAVANPEVK